MAVKNVDTGEVHKGVKGEKTGCGFDTSSKNWLSSHERITCAKDGCKN